MRNDRRKKNKFKCVYVMTTLCDSTYRLNRLAEKWMTYFVELKLVQSWCFFFAFGFDDAEKWLPYLNNVNVVFVPGTRGL